MDDDKDNHSIHTIKKLSEAIFKPKFIILVFLLYGFMALPLYMEKYENSFSLFIKEGGLKFISFFGATLIISFLTFELLKVLKENREAKFSDVDARRRHTSDSPELMKVLRELEELKNQQANIDPNKIKELLNETKRKAVEDEAQKYKSFSSYFNTIRNLLEDKATIADEKASILLDKGISYSKGGIFFFIVSIMAWQILSWSKGFQEQFIYGIVSCSLLFVFIEFLSAWFLKQYRHFVDTSTYLIKVKSIFDRYMLSYLLCTNDLPENALESHNILLETLGGEIKWPESYLLKNADISFAKEALDTMSHFAQTMKTEAKGISRGSKQNQQA
ncbi:MAG TPA: hypothetical protein HPP95_12545 [Deltaproteobacteria bacterium]|nr:hypothetical protein [Deltaproteobacteria bacterium]